MSFLAFLLSAMAISLSGVLAPGPITAVTLGKATRSPHVGAVIALGHGVVEFPLMLAVWYGVSFLQTNTAWKIGVGLVGGLLLLMMGVGMLRSACRQEVPTSKAAASALVAGIVLTAANPYFLVWWGSVGAQMVMEAVTFGLAGFVVFAVAHWLCDLFWLWFMSVLAYRGGQFFGHRFQKVTFAVCGVFLLLMAGKFLSDAIVLVRA